MNLYRKRNKLVIEIEFDGEIHEYSLPGSSSAQMVEWFYKSKIKELEEAKCQKNHLKEETVI
ncbi:MAG: hypothetical protein KBT35_01300 [Firmicutes bacterium]|nr:hypothetical protein [Candidatus Colivicinus equi]